MLRLRESVYCCVVLVCENVDTEVDIICRGQQPTLWREVSLSEVEGGRGEGVMMIAFIVETNKLGLGLRKYDYFDRIGSKLLFTLKEFGLK